MCDLLPFKEFKKLNIRYASSGCGWNAGSGSGFRAGSGTGSVAASLTALILLSGPFVHIKGRKRSRAIFHPS